MTAVTTRVEGACLDEFALDAHFWQSDINSAKRRPSMHNGEAHVHIPNCFRGERSQCFPHSFSIQRQKRSGNEMYLANLQKEHFDNGA